MATIIGTSGNDELSGLGGNDLIKGLEGGDFLFGLDGNDEILGGSGDDTVYGAAGDDLLRGDSGNDYLDGGEGSDTLLGGGGVDTLDGGLGADSMAGAALGDIYYVDHVMDVVTESADHGGVDVVNAAINYTLVENVENLNLVGGANMTGTGNAGPNLIVGNGGVNRIEGLGGNDKIQGGEGNDTLVGGEGDDRLDGGIGIDTYYVDSVGDVVIDPDGGYIYSTVDWDLRDTPTITHLILEGSADIDARGNGLANTLQGNGGINVLNGGSGNDNLLGGAGDTLYGGANNDQLRGTDCIAYGGKGNDTYFLRSNLDTPIAFENAGEGNDYLQIISNRNAADVIFLPENFEDIRLNLEYEVADVHGTAAGDRIEYIGGGRLYGGLGNDVLRHSRGDDQRFPDLLMDGGAGNDSLYGYSLMAETLVGGAGADMFYLTTGNKVDTLADFEDGIDGMVLRSADFNLAAGSLSAANFHAGTAAADADDRIVYDASTGSVYYDADGSGATAQLRFAVLAPTGATITHADFQVAV